MVRAELAIRKEIEEITIDHIAYVKQDIKRDIKYMYWQEVFDDSLYTELNALLDKKCSEVFEMHFNRIYKAYANHLLRKNDKI